MTKVIAILLFTLSAIFSSFAQGLESIPPVLPDSVYHHGDKATSFLLNAIDFHSYAKKGDRLYSSAIEIVDADKPWPPRWFTSANTHVEKGMTNFKDVYIDARYQNNKLTFYTEEAFAYPDRKETTVAGYIICNDKLEPIDTFHPTGLSLNYHEFRINEKGEKLVMVKLDTVLDMREESHNSADSAIKSEVDLIEIFDSLNKPVFVWNPVKVIGAASFYFPYRGDITYSAKPGYFDWSHGNAADFDFDGNIIYSFRHIGIGKLSRATGRVMGYLDRNRMPYISGTDTVAIYRQHGLDKVSEDSLYSTYEVFSNGDSDNPGAYGLLFTVNKKTGALKVIKKQKPPKEVLSLSSGDYEVEKNGDYIMDYGVVVTRDKDITDSSTGSKIFLQYGNSNNKIYALYSIPDLINCFRVHLLREWRPPRPEVVKAGNILTATGSMKEWTWYKLSGRNKTVVKEVGKGNSFTPASPGTYCVAGKYGLGWSVSLPFNYKP